MILLKKMEIKQDIIQNKVGCNTKLTVIKESRSYSGNTTGAIGGYAIGNFYVLALEQ